MGSWQEPPPSACLWASQQVGSTAALQPACTVDVCWPALAAAGAGLADTGATSRREGSKGAEGMAHGGQWVHTVQVTIEAAAAGGVEEGLLGRRERLLGTAKSLAHAS